MDGGRRGSCLWGACSEIKRRRNMMPPPGAVREHVNRKKEQKGKSRKNKIKLWYEEHSRQASPAGLRGQLSIGRKGPFPQLRSRCYSRRNENRLENGKKKRKEMRASI